MKNILINKRNNILFITLVLLSSLSGMAQASMVYEDVGFISGTGSASDSFQISSPGSYQVTLTDFEFPAEFEELDLAITSSGQSYGTFSGPGVYSFDVTSPGWYWANIAGNAGGSLDLGLYGIQIQSLATPLPASLLLLASALVVMIPVNRRRPSNTNNYNLDNALIV